MRSSHYLVKKIYVPRGYRYRVRFYKKRRPSSYPRFNYKRFRRIRTRYITRYIKEEDLDKELDQIEKNINKANNDDNKPEENKENQNQNQMKVDENP